MLCFNPSMLRYKFIYLTKNLYDGIAVHSIFKSVLNNTDLQCPMRKNIDFSLIDKYINFIPFSLRFGGVYKLKQEKFEEDVILSLNNKKSIRLTFSNVLFFVDMYEPDKTSFLYLHGCSDKKKVESYMSFFLQHCHATVHGDEKKQCRQLHFTLREQQIIFYLLRGLSIKKIAHELDVSDKTIYNDKAKLIKKLKTHQKLIPFRRRK